MLRFIWDKVRKILPVSLCVAACGTFCYLLMKHAGEDEAALVGLAAIGIACFLVGYMFFCGLRDVLRLRRDFILAETMDEFQAADVIHPNLRMGDQHLFFNTVTLAYEDISEIYCAYEPLSGLRGQTTWWFILYALDQNHKNRRVLLIQEKEAVRSRKEATELFTRVIDIVAGKNPAAVLHYPDYK